MTRQQDRDKMWDRSQEKNICVTSISSGHELAENFLHVLEPLANEVFLITVNYPQSALFSPRIRLMNIRHNSKGQLTLVTGCKYMIMQLKFCYHLARIASQVDVVILFLSGTTSLLPMLTAKLLQKKTLLITAGSAPREAKQQYKRSLFGTGGFVVSRLFSVLEKLSYSLIDGIVVYTPGRISDLALDRYRNKIILDESGTAAAYNLCVDTSLMKPKQALSHRENLVGYVGRFSEEKGIKNFVEAIPLILNRRNDVEFLIGGHGTLFQEIEERLKDSNFGARVKLTGWIPHDKLPDYLNQLKLIVLPSYSEGLPSLMLEAMACGTPVLATPVGSIPDIIKDGETGFILQDNSPECIAENVARTLNHPHLDKIAASAQNVIEKEYTYEVTVERYRRILGRLRGNEQEQFA